MTDKNLDHPDIPTGYFPVPSHSEFGKQVGYTHYASQREDAENLFCLGLTLEDNHGGAPGRAHGAVTMAMLDEVMGRAASKMMGKICYTASMTTNFCAGPKIGDFLLANASVSRTGKSLVFVDGTIHSGDTLIATATGTWINSGMDIPS